MDKQIEIKLPNLLSQRRREKNQIVIMQNDLTILGGKAYVEDMLRT